MILAANASGKITSVEIWAQSQLTDFEVGIFEQVSPNTFTSRSSVVIGTVPAGSKQTFVVDLTVQAGDYIGYYGTAGNIRYSDNQGTGFWYAAGDQIPCTDKLFGWAPGTYAISLYGTGATLGGPKSNPSRILMGYGGI